MSSPTAQYKSLKKSLTELNVLLSRVPDLDCDTNLQHLKVQSYIFLAHAAFEQYLEEIARYILNSSVTEFNSQNSMNICVASLITFETINRLDKLESKKRIKGDVAQKLKTFVNDAKNNHLNVIKNNNGIKLENQQSLLLPVGMDPEAVDFVTAGSLDSFGSKRGGVAHKFQIRREETKNSVLGATKGLLDGLLNFDEEAKKIVHSKSPVI